MIKLAPRHEIFCQEWLLDRNNKEAAIRAGYSAKSAKQRGCDLYHTVLLRLRIQELLDEQAARLRVTQDRVVQELARIAFTNICDVGEVVGGSVVINDTSDISEDAQAAISEIRNTRYGANIKMHDKRGALDSLAKRFGMYSEKLEISGTGGAPIDTNFTVNFVPSPTD